MFMDFGAQFNAIVARYYAEKETNKAAVFQRYKEEMHTTAKTCFSVQQKYFETSCWHEDLKDRLIYHFQYYANTPRYCLHINFSLTKAVYSKS